MTSSEQFRKIVQMNPYELADFVGDRPNYAAFDGAEGLLLLQAVLRSLVTEIIDFEQSVERLRARVNELEGKLNEKK